MDKVILKTNLQDLIGLNGLIVAADHVKRQQRSCLTIDNKSYIRTDAKGVALDKLAGLDTA